MTIQELLKREKELTKKLDDVKQEIRNYRENKCEHHWVDVPEDDYQGDPPDYFYRIRCKKCGTYDGDSKSSADSRNRNESRLRMEKKQNRKGTA